jgi:hypothetical protein
VFSLAPESRRRRREEEEVEVEIIVEGECRISQVLQGASLL